MDIYLGDFDWKTNICSKEFEAHILQFRSTVDSHLISGISLKQNFRDFEKVKLFSLMWNLKGKVPTLVKNRPEAENFENFSH